MARGKRCGFTDGLELIVSQGLELSPETIKQCDSESVQRATENYRKQSQLLAQ